MSATRKTQATRRRHTSVPRPRSLYNLAGSRRPWLRCSSVEYLRVFALLAPCQERRSLDDLAKGFRTRNTRSSCRRLAWWLGLLLLAHTTALAERLPIRTFTTRNGLRSNTILNITEDSRGFIWFSTRDGLSRFDGHGFVNYSKEDGLPVPTINHFLESSRGVYWVATNGGGVCRFDPRPSTSETGGRESPFTIFPVGEGRDPNAVNFLYEDSEGAIWAATDGGLYHFNPARGDESSVSGGRDNTADGDYSTVSGGRGNVATAEASHVP